jgi:L-alanine-DL-glutamate epimerase-like enolase superfamily enzyme
MFEARAVDVVMYDVTWCGGISEAKKISDMADTYKIPTSPHTGGRPVLWYASIHTATALTNFYIMESVFHLYNDLYPHFLEQCAETGRRLRHRTGDARPRIGAQGRTVPQRRRRHRDHRRVVADTRRGSIMA